MSVATRLNLSLVKSARRSAITPRAGVKRRDGGAASRTRHEYSLPHRYRTPYNIDAGRLLRVAGPQNSSALPVRTPPSVRELRSAHCTSLFCND